MSFPKINNGSCDGMGCSNKPDKCWCNEHVKSCEEYQRVFNNQWINPWLEGGEDCKKWDEAWRYAFNRYNK